MRRRRLAGRAPRGPAAARPAPTGTLRRRRCRRRRPRLQRRGSAAAQAPPAQLTLQHGVDLQLSLLEGEAKEAGKAPKGGKKGRKK